MSRRDRVKTSLRLRDAQDLQLEPPPGFPWPRPHGFFEDDRVCRRCGCTDLDCMECIERTGEPCFWVEHDLCSACAFEKGSAGMSSRNGNRKQLVDLQDALFGQIDRLSNPAITKDELELEVARMRSLTDVASRIVDVGRLSVDAWDAAARHGTTLRGKPLPLLTGPEDDAA